MTGARPRRGLALRRERLAELAPAELGSVNGGTHEGSQCVCPTRACPTIGPDDCLARVVTPLVGQSLPCG